MKEVFDVSVILPIKSALSVGFIDYFEKSIELRDKINKLKSK